MTYDLFLVGCSYSSNIKAVKYKVSCGNNYYHTKLPAFKYPRSLFLLALYSRNTSKTSTEKYPYTTTSNLISNKIYI